MSSRDPLADLLAGVAASLETVGARWYLFGAQAVVIWGRPRLTADIDVTVELPPEALDSALRALGERGFRLRITFGVEEFLRRTRVLPFRHEASGMLLDLVLAGPGLEEEFLDRAIAVPFGDRSYPVISPEDLVVTKILAGRPKDLEDVRGVLAERSGRLDLDRIRTVLRLLEEALGQSDLLPLFEGEVSSRGGSSG